MNKLLSLALASILPLAACTATPVASTNGASMTPVAGERYCFKRNLYVADGKLTCNWVTDRKQACTARNDEVLDAARYSAPAPSGRCETGEYLVKVQPR